MTKIALVGDLHGNTRWFESVVRELVGHGVTTIYQVGDFGIWPGDGGKTYLDRVKELCKSNGLVLWITPGNHDDYSQIEDPADGDGTERQVLSQGEDWEVAVLPRGYSWEDGGMTFVSFGGAPSIDYPHRMLGKDWWQEEMIRESDLDRLHRSEGADVMICHDAPDGGTTAVQEIIDTPPHKSSWSESGLAYARQGRMLMNRAVEIVNPRVFCHGHYHVSDHRYDSKRDTWFLSLDADGTHGNVILLDTETQEFRWFD